MHGRLRFSDEPAFIGVNRCTGAIRKGEQCRQLIQKQKGLLQDFATAPFSALFGYGETDIFICLDALAVEVELQCVFTGLLRRAQKLAHIVVAGPHVIPGFFTGIVIHNGAILVPNNNQCRNEIIAVLQSGDRFAGECNLLGRFERGADGLQLVDCPVFLRGTQPGDNITLGKP